MKKKQRWRKFPEEKPKWGEEVIVVDDESKYYIVRFSHDFKWISWGKMNTRESNCVKYWMPMPLAPKEVRMSKLKPISVLNAYQVECDDNELVYRKSEVDVAIAELKEEVNEQTFKLCVEKENVWQLELLFQEQKDKADKLLSCLKCLVMRDLIKDCTEKVSAIANKSRRR